MRNFTMGDDELEQALRPIASLIGKSEKAQLKLVPGSWQHRMLEDNLKALRIASALMGKEPHATENFTREDFQEALRALASMIGRSEKAQGKFSPGASQHTLQKNRIHALRLAAECIGSALEALGGA